MLVAGVDEAGRGPLAGPVIAAAVILDPKRIIQNLADSKALTAQKREILYQEIFEKALAVGMGRAEVFEIDTLNILQATLLAMQRAVSNLQVVPMEIWVDGNCSPSFGYPSRAVIGGDALVPSISAASIVAKVSRDREMVVLDHEYPEYGFAQHKGYPTAAHRAVLKLRGPCLIHRRSFTPVREALEFI
jgi:ribonuclease HII